jgi:YjbE family integral membrane protein
LDVHLIFSVFSIVLVDLILGGDNAVVIAMAVRALPKAQRMRGIAIGAGGAVVLRVAATFFAARMLQTRFIQLLGGILIVWIAIKLFSGAESSDDPIQEPRTFWRSVGYIVVADITMSTDNVLAVAAASHGSLPLLTFGLGLSIPFVVVASNILTRLMDRYSWIIYLGAAILGRVGAEMILTDAYTTSVWRPSNVVRYAIEAMAVVGVLIAGRMLTKRQLPAE